MQINYQMLVEDFNATYVIVEGKYVIIYGLDGSITKIHLDYLNQKYIIKSDK